MSKLKYGIPIYLKKPRKIDGISYDYGSVVKHKSGNRYSVKLYGIERECETVIDADADEFYAIERTTIAMFVPESTVSTLLHCLRYGKAAVSQVNVENGDAEKRDMDIDFFLKQLTGPTGEASLKLK